MMLAKVLTKLGDVPQGVNLENSIGIELVEEVPVLRASVVIQRRIEELLEKQQFDRLSEQEKQEIDFYAELDDYLSLVNRTMRNIAWAEKPSPI
jgi:hypothetical protein